ncbi:metal-dependent transcriptional regulator [Lactococcus kimchii]|uniref:metal-dependent transcriptional regulator n=1 Tax=Lactococcus sp. S-13 TaxID=2507158 RepID=UPI0010231F2E|nr:metal-dependent transcriptional regulator [Lactococcus sp. S-13]RZI48169.1 metal-dependent transcriptional regulator [Lactococcus sp. S-13]
MLTLSKTEQDYLKAIYTLEKKDTKASVSIHQVAQRLSVANPSVTEMVNRLSKKGLVDYFPYRGMTLTPSGVTQARFILKSHRVWETFLVEKLGYSTKEVHEEAENLEHASSPKLVESLYALLDYPQKDPHGSSIPSELFWTENNVEITLNQAETNKSYAITALDNEGLDFFRKLKQPLPHLITIIEVLQDNSLIIKEDNEKMIIIPLFLQDKIRVIQRTGQISDALS